MCIEPAEREHGGRALHEKPHAKARQTTQFPILTSKKDTKDIIENQSKINQKSTEHPRKIHPKSILEASWGPLGPLEGVLVSLGAS